jgi:hypothetical protein
VQLLNAIGRRIARFLSAPRDGAPRIATTSREKLSATLRPGDVLLVEGTSLFAGAIKFLTQSTWSHSALYIGNALGSPPEGEEALVFVEADINAGVRAVPLSSFWNQHYRICRPVGLSRAEVDRVVGYAVERIGHQYDLKNIFDLLRYVLPAPPVPRRWRRQLLSLGSGDPTRAICSTLIAQAFQCIDYPILPEVYVEGELDAAARADHREWLHIRHYSLYAPRDFDVSPYFEVVKPALAQGFNFHALDWADTQLLTVLKLKGPHLPA